MSWLKSKQGIIGLLLIVIVASGFIGYKIMYKPHAVIEEVKADFTGEAKEFSEQIKANPEQWNNNIVMLTGTITSKEEKGIVLNGSVYCQYKEGTNANESLTEQSTITIKARVIGYDDLLEEIKLDQTIIIKH